MPNNCNGVYLIKLAVFAVDSDLTATINKLSNAVMANN